YDVVIVGGGPTGSTAASMLRKYNPDLSVLIVEKAKFPRDHVGESQLPSISSILDEMGVWEKVEAAGFPIKIGASYTWGKKADRWDFDFYPAEQFVNEPRPAKYEGQRRWTAFQVDRAIYDDILLRHAEELGAEVREETKVDQVLVEGDRIEGLVLHTGETVRGRYYIDGSGTVGLLRRALGVESDVPMELRNIAVWDYWEDAEWAVEIGVGGTRVQVRSLPYGWIWFIPLGPTRTSIGLICPSEHYKKTGLSPAELYKQAISEQPDIRKLTANATSRGMVESCKDWSHLANKLVGENWFLAGESAGFADPILAAGMSLAHSSAREVAYSILELERGELDPQWVRHRYDERNRTNIGQHIRFAQYWYAANGQFTDLKEHCQSIAKEAGLKLTPDRAWRWLSQGGFTTESAGLPTFGSFDVSTTRQLLSLFDDRGRKQKYNCDGYNVFKLNLANAEKSTLGVLKQGRIEQIECYVRGEAKLPLTGYYGLLIKVLGVTEDFVEILDHLKRSLMSQGATGETLNLNLAHAVQALDVMIDDYWVLRSKNPKRPMVNVNNDSSRFIRSSEAGREALEKSGSAKFNI
ncbi:MAG: NAD(P)/FAD-dependent oxidoreductase, partial [Phycisphaerales bacterium]